MPKLFMVMNEDVFLLSHRREIAVEAVRRGFDVCLAAVDTGRRAEVESLGVRMVDMPVNPTGMNLMQELRTLMFLCRLYRRERPDIVHHIGLKSVLWGTLAARLVLRRAMVVNAVAGLGIIFSGERLSTAARGILSVLRLADGRRVRYIFQNRQDEALFLSRRVTSPDRTTLIKGSGVDLQRFAFVPEPSSPPVTIIFAARMVEEKGVCVLAEAAEMLREEYGSRVRFLLCGGLTDNPHAVSRRWFEENCDGRYIAWLGHRSDICELLARSHIAAFPSWYREGVPKSLIEACAVGRPIVTCDSTGCRDTVDDGVNGFLIPPKDSAALAAKLRMLIDDSGLRRGMGAASRRKAESEFSVADVVRRHMELYMQYC